MYGFFVFYECWQLEGHLLINEMVQKKQYKNASNLEMATKG